MPLEVRCRVALRQLGEMWPDDVIERWREGDGFKALLAQLLTRLAGLLNCDVVDLHLDHDPALATRQRSTGERKPSDYFPDANDPQFLIYREKHAHHIKTNVRGDGAQYPDRVLIKRERKRRNKTRNKKRKVWRSRPLRSASRWPKRKMR